MDDGCISVTAAHGATRPGCHGECARLFKSRHGWKRFPDATLAAASIGDGRNGLLQSRGVHLARRRVLEAGQEADFRLLLFASARWDRCCPSTRGHGAGL